MAYERFMIAPINTGLQTDVKPWLIPDDAFAELQNAYLFRGRVRKRFGSYLLNQSVSVSVQQLYSRLRINIGTTDGAGNFGPSVVPGNTSSYATLGKLFSVGNSIFTVYQIGAPAAMLTTGPGTGTYNTTTGAVTISGSTALTDVFYYPATPVMGFINYEIDDINAEPLFAFDTQFAYQYTSGAWTRVGAAVWTGDDSQFFWGVTYRGASASNNLLFVTNYNIGTATTGDPIRYWDGSTWTNLNAASAIINSSGDTIKTARIIIPFQNRLLLLNTVELTGGPTQTVYYQRCRYSQLGSPIAADAWREDIPGRGGFLDAPTQQAIITAQLFRNRLIVYFESSTWELVYTGNEVLPFRWQQLNIELGAESTFSQIPFDKVILGVGNVGIHACNGVNVERIDEKIPQAVFQIHNENNGPERVFGIRDYFLELVYWTFPAAQNNPKFPTRVLIYNYRTPSWAFNDDSITAFGYFETQGDETWNSVTRTWDEMTDPWNSGEIQSNFPEIIAGNQEGFTFIVDSDTTRNAPSLQITNISVSSNVMTITAYNHNLQNQDFVIIENASGITGINNIVYQVTTVINDNSFQVLTSGTVGGSYSGGGTLARVSVIDILTKQYNFYVDQGRNAYFAKVDFLVDRTSDGEISIDWFTSSSTLSLVDEGLISGSILGNGVLETKPYTIYPYEQTQERLWHPIYLQADGEFIQLRLFWDIAQVSNTDISWSDFQLHAMTFYATPTSDRLQ